MTNRGATGCNTGGAPTQGHAPRQPLRYCATQGCGHKVTTGHCPAHQQQRREVETRFSKGKYGRPWRRAVAQWIAEDPDERVFCVQCKAEGKDVLATDTDHVTPHRGDDALFWDRANWQRLCQAHHSSKTAKETGWR